MQNPHPRSIAELGQILERNKYMNPAMNGFNVRQEAMRAAKDMELAERLENEAHQD